MECRGTPGNKTSGNGGRRDIAAAAAVLRQTGVAHGGMRKTEETTVTGGDFNCAGTGTASVALAAEGMEPLTGEDVFTLRPYYIRKSEAEELWEKRHPRG